MLRVLCALLLLFTFETSLSFSIAIAPAFGIYELCSRLLKCYTTKNNANFRPMENLLLGTLQYVSKSRGMCFFSSNEMHTHTISLRLAGDGKQQKKMVERQILYWLEKE